MTYEINDNGLTVPSLQEHIDDLTFQFKEIYGEELDFSQNTPDGQLINIQAQNQTDIDETIIDLYNNLDVNYAEGRALDNLVSNHLIKRQAGSYTLVPIDITTSGAVQLEGLDENYEIIESSNVFTVEDNVGNQFYLVTSVNIENAGTTTATFRAKDMGVIEVVLNTITNIITPVVGVTSVNNSTSPLQIGVDEETDLNLRNRYFKTYANGGFGSFDNILSALYNVVGVVEVKGENNNENTTSIYGTLPHTIWIIVLGGSDDDIANAIYSTIGAGCGMRGNITYNIVGMQGQTFEIKFDRPSYENLYIQFTIVKKDINYVYNPDYIKEQLINKLSFSLYNTIDINQISNILYTIDENLIYKNVSLSKDGTTWQDIITNTNKNYIFELTANNITINT